MADIEPTERGLRNYHNGYYDEKPCTCLDKCRICKGECGCEACHYAYQDFLSADW